MAIKNILNSWWLRGHLIVLVFVGVLGYNIVSYHSVMAIHTKGSEIIESIPTVLPRRTATAGVHIRTTSTITVITPTKVATEVPTATPTIDSYRGNWPDCYYVVTQFYGQNGEQGDDFGCNEHTRLIALWSGTVQYAGRTCWNTSCTSSSGGVIIIRATIPGLGAESYYYLHIDALAPGIRIGTYVKRGEFVALSGGQLYGGQWPASPEFSEGPHLEIGIDAWFLCQSMVQCSGVHVNPYYYIREAMN